MQCGAATAAAAAAASSYSTTAAAASAYPPNSAPPGETSQWTGNGLSQHVDTLDTTQWMDVRLQLLTQVIRQQTADLYCPHECMLTGFGVSVLRRSTMGASRALHALLIEEQQEHVRLARRFSGDAYRLSDGKKVKLPIAAPAVSASVNQVVVNQKYPGVDGSKFVVVPFLLLGSINFKTGAVRLEKVHIRYVFNNITYRGQVRVVGPDMNGQHEELKYDALMRQLEASSSQSQPVWTQKHKLCFDLSSESSHASLLLNADVAIVPLPDSQHELSASTKLKNSLSRPPEQPKQQPLSDDLARFSPSSTSRFKRSRNSSEAHSQSQPTTNTERSPKRHRIASVSPSQPIGNPLPIAGHVGFGVDLVSVAAASAERAPMDENL